MEIFPSLPEEVGRECLLRVSCQFHSTLRAVCKIWEAVVDSPRFYHDRKRIGISEQCLCLIQSVPSVEGKSHRMPVYALTLYDPLQGLWQRKVSPFPELADGIPLFSECVSVKNKLVLIGGWHPSRWEAMKCVFAYDFSSGKWRKGADMPTARSFFACSVSSSDGLIYVAGGHDGDKNALRGAAVYDVEQDKWRSLAEMNEERDESRGAFIDGKFYVIRGYETESQGRFKQSAQVFDPNTGLWSSLQDMWTVGGCRRSCIAAFGQLYAFHKCGILRYNSAENVSKKVASLPQGLDCVRGATVWCDRIFVSGSQLDGATQICYMFEPLHRNGTTSQMWIAVESTENFAGIVQSAATLQI